MTTGSRMACVHAASILAMLLVAGSETDAQTRTPGCSASSAEIERQIAGFRSHPPTIVSLGLYAIASNSATAAVTRSGGAAADALLRASHGDDRVVAVLSMPPACQNLSGNRISMADIPSSEYGVLPELMNYKHVQVFTTCAVSAAPAPPCRYKRCCAEWTRQTVVQDDQVAINTIVKNRTWCE